MILGGRFTPEEVVPSWRIIYWSPQLSFGRPDYWEVYKPRARKDFVDFVDEYVVEPGPYQ